MRDKISTGRFWRRLPSDGEIFAGCEHCGCGGWAKAAEEIQAAHAAEDQVVSKSIEFMSTSNLQQTLQERGQIH